MKLNFKTNVESLASNVLKNVYIRKWMIFSVSGIPADYVFFYCSLK